VFFDLGSTLVDEAPVYRRRVRTMVEGTRVGEETFQRAMEELFRQGKRGDVEAAALWGLTVPQWTREDEVLYPDALPVVRRLSRHRGIGVIANQSLGTADRLRNWGLLPFVSVVAASAEEGVAKPDPRLFEIALGRARCRPQDAVMVGDRLDNDIGPARALGMATVWIRRGYYGTLTVPGDLRADHTIEGLDELEALLGLPQS